MAKTKTKLLVVLACLVLMIAGISALTACNGGETYSVTFMIQNEQGEWEQNGQPVSTDEEGNLTLPQAPSKDYYDFRGWYLTQDFSGEAFTGQNVSADTVVYACFVPIEVTVTFDGETQSEKVLLKDIASGEYMPTPMTGCEFDGWYTNAECTGEKWTSGVRTQQLYARSMARVTFNNGYENVAEQLVVPGTTADRLDVTELAERYDYMDGNSIAFMKDGSEFEFSEKITQSCEIEVTWYSPYLEYDKTEQGNLVVTGFVSQSYDHVSTFPVLSIPAKAPDPDNSSIMRNVVAVVASNFNWASTAQKLIVPEGIQYISAFNSMTMLQNVELPSSLKMMIGAFTNDPSLDSIELPEGLEILIDSVKDIPAENVKLPSTVINLSEVEADKFDFSENTLFSNDDAGNVIKTENGQKILVVANPANLTEDGIFIVPDDIEGIHVGAFDLINTYVISGEVEFTGVVMPTAWSFVDYNEDLTAERSAYYYRKSSAISYLTIETAFDGSMHELQQQMAPNAFAIITNLQSLDKVTIYNEALPDGVRASAIVGASATGDYQDCQNAAYAGKIVYAEPIDEGQPITVQITVIDTLSQAAAAVSRMGAGQMGLMQMPYQPTVVTVSDAFKSGDLLDLDVLLERAELSDMDNIEVLVTETGSDEAYSFSIPCRTNQSITIKWSYKATDCFTFVEVDDGLKITAVDLSKAQQLSGGLYLVTIPDEYNGKPVVEIGEGVFEGLSNISHVVIGKNVKRIGASAFKDIENLKYVGMQAGALESIGESAFENIGTRYNSETGEYTVNSYFDIAIPLANLKEVGAYAFKSKAIYGFVPVAGEEDRYLMDMMMQFNPDLEVGGYYIWMNVSMGNMNIPAAHLVKYTGQSVETIDSVSTTVYDFEYTALAPAGLGASTGYKILHLGYFSKPASSGAFPNNYVMRYKVMEGSVYFLDAAGITSIQFNAISGIEQNAFTDIGSTVKNFSVYNFTSDVFDENYSFVVTQEEFKAQNASVFASGWYEGLTAASDADAWAAFQEMVNGVVTSTTTPTW